MRTGEVIVFDVETTGTERARDQVIELCVQLGLDEDAPHRIWRLRPSVPIQREAQAVHGISMEDLAGCPGFGEVADEVRQVFEKARVLIGYNLAFDIGMLQAEFERLGQSLDLHDKVIVDAFRLWQQCEPRSLQHAHQRFVGDAFAAAHSAAADVAATGRVLRGMLDMFGLAGREWAAIAEVCEPERASWIGPTHHVRWSPEGPAVLGFGKHAGQPLDALARNEDGSYLRWMLSRGDFPPHVREICTRALEQPAEQLAAWLESTYRVTLRAATAVTGVAPGLNGAARAASRVAVAVEVASQVTVAAEVAAVDVTVVAEAAVAGMTDAAEAAVAGVTDEVAPAEAAAAGVATEAAMPKSRSKRSNVRKKTVSESLQMSMW
ncbi:MAG TPA: exonuclease domain-containing protein [Haliangium sp.]|nr:exonuclease domain-containing protein [Haliangium sp.]